MDIVIAGDRSRCSGGETPSGLGPLKEKVKILIWGIIIYGLKFSYSYLAIICWQGLLVVIAAISSALFSAMVLGKSLGLEDKTAALIGVGTAICGITALLATAPGIKAKEEQIGVAVGAILLWGTLALFAYPAIAVAVHMPAAVYGTWCGSSIQDISELLPKRLKPPS